jgi:hypothetical protein
VAARRAGEVGGEVGGEVLPYPGRVAEEEHPEEDPEPHPSEDPEQRLPEHGTPPVDPEDQRWLDEQLLRYEELLEYLRDH